jgi:hypothetical protein
MSAQGLNCEHNGAESMHGHGKKLRRFGLSILFILFLAACLPETAPAGNRALLIGIGRYANGIKLPGIDRDLENMTRAVRLMGFEEDQIRVLAESEATLAGIRKAIQEWLILGVLPEDRVLFYFSGHGSQVRDEDGDEGDGADEVLLPFDAREAGGTLTAAFLDDEFALLLARVPAKEILVFLDACHSGTATRAVRRSGTAGGGEEIVPKVFKYRGMPETGGDFAAEETAPSVNYLALSACRDDEEAHASGKGSFLTRGILNTLDEAAWYDTPVTMMQFQKNTTEFIARDLHSSGRTQHPQITGNRRIAATHIIQVAPGNPWKRLDALAEAPARKIDVRTKNRVSMGETLSIACRPGADGYLNVMNIDAVDNETTVLFPNRLHPDNRVGPDTVLKIPDEGDRFKLIARPPAGKSMIVVFFTQEKIDAYMESVAGPSAMFRPLSTQTLRRLLAHKERNPQGFGAATRVIEIIE